MLSKHATCICETYFRNRQFKNDWSYQDWSLHSRVLFLMISMTECVWRAIFALSLCTIASGASESSPGAMHESNANPKAKINVLQEIVRDTEQTSRGAPGRPDEIGGKFCRVLFFLIPVLVCRPHRRNGSFRRHGHRCAELHRRGFVRRRRQMASSSPSSMAPSSALAPSAPPPLPRPALPRPAQVCSPSPATHARSLPICR